VAAKKRSAKRPETENGKKANRDKDQTGPTMKRK
jgi:hypothetical protein